MLNYSNDINFNREFRQLNLSALRPMKSIIIWHIKSN